MNQAVNTIQELASNIYHMILGWENVVNTYINLINQKIDLLEQERIGLVHLGLEVYSEFVDLYEFDNHLLMFKEINKTLEKIKNRCRRDGRRQIHPQPQKLKIKRIRRTHMMFVKEEKDKERKVH